MVRFYYDHDPTTTSPTHTPYVSLPRNSAIVDWTKAERSLGSRVTLEEFEKILMSERKSLKDEPEWFAEGHKGFETVREEEKEDDE